MSRLWRKELAGFFLCSIIKKMSTKLIFLVVGIAFFLTPVFSYARGVCEACDSNFECNSAPGLICKGGNPATTEKDEGVCQYADSAKVALCNPLGTRDFEGLLNLVVKVIFNLALAIVPLMVVIGGFMFVSAGGKPDQIAKARNLLLWTAVGFVVILIARGVAKILLDLLKT